jgi:hypothetical protein
MLYKIIGLVGAVLILFGFYRTSIGRWNGKSLWYELDNFVGALFLEPFAKRRLSGNRKRRKR